MSIRSKFVLILFFCLAVFAATVSFAARHYAQRESDAMFAAKASAQLDRVDDMIHIYFKSAEQAVKKLAALPGVQDIALARNASGTAPAQPGMDTALVQVLSALPSLVPGVEAAFCGYKNGSFHASSRTPHGEYDGRTRSWYSDTAWGAGETSITDLAISDTSKSLVATVAAKIKDGAGETLGVAGLTVSLAALTDTLRDVRLGETGFLVLFDAKGRILFDPNAQENLLLPASEAAPLLLSAMQLPAGKHVVKDGGTPLVIYSRMLSDSRWKAAFIMEEAERAASGTSLTLAVGGVAAAVAAILGLIGMTMTFGATRPLYALINQSKALAGGNAEAMAGIAGRGPDIVALQSSIGQLMGRVILLAQAEKEHAGEIEAYVRKAVAVEQVQADKNTRETRQAACRAIAENLKPLAADIASSAAAIGTCAAKADEFARNQSAALGETRSATDALLADAATMARQAAETEKSADASLLLLRKTDQLSRSMTLAAEAMEENAHALAPGLEAFRTGTTRMAGQTAVMRDVAEAVNVLGLKLSIEISTAGEAGEKFAPVTEEMRLFAEKTMTAAGSMDAVIAAVEQTQSAHTLAVNKTVHAARHVAGHAVKTATALTQAAGSVFTTVEQLRVLSTALEGLAQTDGPEWRPACGMEKTARDAHDTLDSLAGHAASLTAMAEKLANLTAELEKPATSGSAARDPGQIHKSLD